MDYTNCDIRKLAELIKQPEDDQSSSDDDLPKSGFARLGPGDVDKKLKVKVLKGQPKEVKEKEKAAENDPNSIWSLSEVPIAPYSDDALNDPREEPKYNVMYQQNVGAEDIYLQMSNKTPTTASCERLIVTVFLHGEDKNAIDCNIMDKHLDVRSPKYRLSLPLPHPVDTELSHAQWDHTMSELKVIFYLKREFDFVNF